ncbi:midnolin homolog [Malaya genurostris]|uniref:midnolin homolog n=1 Tax=Malaya genurostris TaxID=325434 RepID=UPI0026F3AB64|nr:midnolin homolog [Malaya genurostris]XP_058445259.1 midnolin homolog [Malaya genurostris]XP_058445260.1 midnolin homolog [Malaya genurostris]XP_058445261.1 midnolin homolog [Malaya genurostris]XP_058445263.1 midnolin homolog [Malaya genurostris]XP_058445264.1 midnolin homolog [Malaya genurostris]XP_058445265.1 midnolin homolog [Malaya genurostris]XP_058445266.1 midnolin homolog [Malaya genurostris]
MADYCSSGGGGSSSPVSSNGGSCLGTFRPSGASVAIGVYPHHKLAHHHHLNRHHLRVIAPAGGGGGAEQDEQNDGGHRPSTAAMLGTVVIDHRVRIIRLTRPQNFDRHHHLHGPGTGAGAGGGNAGGGGGNFGFSIRGGLEYGTGFFVSAVEKDSEADRQGLKVGDQIVRVNGYHVEDAVHRELTQFVANQERLVLKVRSVGIIPIKERSADPLTWHVISFNGSSSSTMVASSRSNGSSGNQSSLPRVERTSCSSSSSSSTGSGTVDELPPPGRDLKIMLSVPPQTKLGCGICKGPDWKPGIFVQFTKQGGVAREAGLRPGDQIMSCNGREFSEITFAEAVSIMKASHVLELVIRPGAGIDMFPGESSGYNSSASSVNGDASPCWGESAAKRLSMVREESGPNERLGSGSKSASNRRNNTTIIEFSENGTVVNSSNSLSRTKPESEDRGNGKKLADISFVSKKSETKTIIVEVHRSASTNSIDTGLSPSSGSATSSGLSSNIPPPPPLFADKIPPPPPPNTNNNNSGLSSGYSTTNSGRSAVTGQQRSPSAVSLADSSASSGIDCGGGSGLGSAISEELKRRAQKKGTSTALEPAAALTELENRLKEKRFRPPNSGGSDAARHSALMDEFRAVHKRMFKNGFDNAELKKTPSKDKLPTDDGSSTETVPVGPGGRNGKGTMGRVAEAEQAKANGDVAELESIESFKMTNPTPTTIRPPSYYFSPQATGPPTMKKTLKPIAVTISEYSSSLVGQRDHHRSSGDVKSGTTGTVNEEDAISASIGNLRSELEKTLSMSNLRLRCESRENLVERIQIGPCGHHQQDQQAKLSRSSSVANGVGRIGAGSGSAAAKTMSNGNRITIAISNDKN